MIPFGQSLAVIGYNTDVVEEIYEKKAIIRLGDGFLHLLAIVFFLGDL